MSFKLYGPWSALANLTANIQRELPRAVADEAQALAEKMREGITSGAPAGQAFAPHAPLTGIFGGSKPLNRTGALVASIQAFKVGPNRYFVGIRGPAARIGNIHEYGRSWTQVWTAKQRAFFFAKLREADVAAQQRRKGTGSGVVVQIRIPARPFVGPIRDVFGPIAAQRIVDRVARAAGLR